VRSASVAEIEQQLRLNFDTLAIRLRDLPARHRSMRAAFDHSWELLSAPERSLWSWLAIFRGGWTPEAAEQVADATLPDLVALADRSLIRVGDEPRRPSHVADVVDGVTTARFTMLEPLREYALDRLATDPDAALIRRRHARYYAALAASAHLRLTGVEHAAWMRRLNDDHDNLRIALDWALREREAELGLSLGASLAGYWRIRGHLQEGRQRLHDLLEAFPQPLAPRIPVLLGAIMLAGEQGDHAQARQLAEAMLADARTLGAPQCAGSSARAFSRVYRTFLVPCRSRVAYPSRCAFQLRIPKPTSTRHPTSASDMARNVCCGLITATTHPPTASPSGSAPYETVRKPLITRPCSRSGVSARR
jgi:non-specific serine/threonine protein kinase